MRKRIKKRLNQSALNDKAVSRKHRDHCDSKRYQQSVLNRNKCWNQINHRHKEYGEKPFSGRNIRSVIDQQNQVDR